MEAGTFSEMKLFQVRPDKLDEFEKLIMGIQAEQRRRSGCVRISYLKRTYVLDDLAPRELTKIVKSVKYVSYWEFATKDDYAQAVKWFFGEYLKPVSRLLIMPFDVYCGYSPAAPEAE
ncbi:MAG: hypothetical protein AB7F40_09690 [Victivallaceae bacterium]|nr:hypothetical protein [Victivallaceae bacterium]